MCDLNIYDGPIIILRTRCVYPSQIIYNNKSKRNHCMIIINNKKYIIIKQRGIIEYIDLTRVGNNLCMFNEKCTNIFCYYQHDSQKSNDEFNINIMKYFKYKQSFHIGKSIVTIMTELEKLYNSGELQRPNVPVNKQKYLSYDTSHRQKDKYWSPSYHQMKHKDSSRQDTSKTKHSSVTRKRSRSPYGTEDMNNENTEDMNNENTENMNNENTEDMNNENVLSNVVVYHLIGLYLMQIH